MRTASRRCRLPPALLPVCLACGLVWGAGCATTPLNSARSQFRQGQIQEAEAALELDHIPEKDPMLFLVERGTIRQAAGRYEDSARDYVAATAHLEALETYSLSQGGASLVINDTVQEFKGKPYEWTMLHSMAALSYLAFGAWDDAAVEARLMLERLDAAVEKEFPDDPFARYLAGFCFEMIDDPSNARIEYLKAAALLDQLDIDERGRLRRLADESDPAPPADLDHELVCFVMLGSIDGPGGPGYAELYADDRYLGRTYPFVDSAALAAATRERLAALRAAKTATRVVIKDGIAGSVGSATGNEAWGDLTRLVLIGLLERPDRRHWETLPASFQIARVPCPPDLTSYDLVIKSAPGSTLREFSVVRPLVRRRRIFFSFYRDLPGRQ